MTHVSPVRPTDPAVKAYHDALKTFAHHLADHEGATETAFSRLLADTAKAHGWTLIPKKGMKVGGKQIYPDGTLQDGNFLPRGYWEAKDTDDKLDVEIVKKQMIALANRSLYCRPTEVVSARRAGSPQPRATPWVGHPIPTPA